MLPAEISPSTILFIVGSFGAVAILALWTARRVRGQILLDRKLDQISGNKISNQDTARLLQQRQQGGDELVNDAILRFLPTLGRTKMMLRQSGLKIDIKLYVFFILAVTAVISQFVELAAIPGWLKPIAIAVPLHLLLERVVLSKLIEIRKAKMIRQIGVSTDFIVRGVQVGQSVEQAIADAAESVEEPLRAHLRMVGRLTEVGVSLPNALVAVARDVDLTEFDFFVAAVQAQIESGGNLSSALTNLVDVIRARHQLQLKVAALTAEGKISAFILGSMPILIFAYLVYSRPDYVEPFFTRDIGQILMYAGFVLIALGIWVMFKLIRIKV